MAIFWGLKALMNINKLVIKTISEVRVALAHEGLRTTNRKNNASFFTFLTK